MISIVDQISIAFKILFKIPNLKIKQLENTIDILLKNRTTPSLQSKNTTLHTSNIYYLYN
jgi:hypothetical protein